MIYMPSTHLISQNPKRVYVTGRRSSGVCQSEAFRVNQFWGSAMEEPINVHPWRGGRNKSDPKAGNMDMSISVDEDIGLDGHKCTVETWSGGRAYDLDIPMHDVEVM